jgi:hypothetical protein
MGKRGKPAVTSAWLWTTAADNGVGGVTKEITMRDLRASKRRGLVSKAKSWLRHPGTFKTAAFVLNVLNLVLRVIDHFK